MKHRHTLFKITGALVACGIVAAPAQLFGETRDQKFRRIMAIGLEMERQSAPIDAVLKTANFTGIVGLSGGGPINTWEYIRDETLKPDPAPEAKLWRWASVTKQVVAVLVMQEVEAGRIDLDAPIARYVPAFKGPTAKSITVRQLLRHQSGLPNPDDRVAQETGGVGFNSPLFRGNRSPLTGYCAGKPKAAAGGNWEYNNCDYMVAGALLEAVTGKSWTSLVEARIKTPLKLKTLGVFPTDITTRSGIVGGKTEPLVDLASFGASAGLFGSVEDLVKFDHALISGKLLNTDSLRTLWDGQPELGYIALGQWVFDAPLKDCAKPVKLVERRGAIGGVQVRNFIAPDLKMAVVAFADKSEADFQFGEIWQGAGFSHDLLNAALCGKMAPK